MTTSKITRDSWQVQNDLKNNQVRVGLEGPYSDHYSGKSIVKGSPYGSNGPSPLGWDGKVWKP